MNSDKVSVMEEFRNLVAENTNFLLPMAAIYETGNHIAQISDGRNRRKLAEEFIKQVEMAIRGDAPWQLMQVPDQDEVIEWLGDFPDSAMRGVGMGDLSMIKDWEKMVQKIPNRRVFIWSLDRDLAGYNHQP